MSEYWGHPVGRPNFCGANAFCQFPVPGRSEPNRQWRCRPKDRNRSLGFTAEADGIRGPDSPPALLLDPESILYFRFHHRISSPQSSVNRPFFNCVHRLLALVRFCDTTRTISLVLGRSCWFRGMVGNLEQTWCVCERDRSRTPHQDSTRQRTNGGPPETGGREVPLRSTPRRDHRRVVPASQWSRLRGQASRCGSGTRKPPCLSRPSSLFRRNDSDGTPTALPRAASLLMAKNTSSRSIILLIRFMAARLLPVPPAGTKTVTVKATLR